MRFIERILGRAKKKAPHVKPVSKEAARKAEHKTKLYLHDLIRRETKKHVVKERIERKERKARRKEARKTKEQRRMEAFEKRFAPKAKKIISEVKRREKAWDYQTFTKADYINDKLIQTLLDSGYSLEEAEKEGIKRDVLGYSSISLSRREEPTLSEQKAMVEDALKTGAGTCMSEKEHERWDVSQSTEWVVIPDTITFWMDRRDLQKEAWFMREELKRKKISGRKSKYAIRGSKRGVRQK